MNITDRHHAAVADMLGDAGFVVVNYSPGTGKAGTHRRPLGWMPSIFNVGLGHTGRRLFDTVTGDNRTDYVGTHRAPRRATPAIVGIVALYVAAAVLAVLIAVGVIPTGVALDHHAAPAAPLTVTLADPHGWTPTALLDPTQVEAGDDAGADALPDPSVDVAALYPLLARMADAGSPDVIRADDTDAPELSECVLVLGDTSVLVCSDGFLTAT